VDQAGMARFLGKGRFKGGKMLFLQKKLFSLSIQVGTGVNVMYDHVFMRLSAGKMALFLKNDVMNHSLQTFAVE
jgi:hypothetical protein